LAASASADLAIKYPQDIIEKETAKVWITAFCRQAPYKNMQPICFGSLQNVFLEGINSTT